MAGTSSPLDWSESVIQKLRVDHWEPYPDTMGSRPLDTGNQILQCDIQLSKIANESYNKILDYKLPDILSDYNE